MTQQQQLIVRGTTIGKSQFYASTHHQLITRRIVNGHYFVNTGLHNGHTPQPFNIQRETLARDITIDTSRQGQSGKVTPSCVQIKCILKMDTIHP